MCVYTMLIYRCGPWRDAFKEDENKITMGGSGK